MPSNPINTTAINNASPVGQAVSYTALAFNALTAVIAVATLGKRRKRHEHHDYDNYYDHAYDHTLQETLFKVVYDLDDPSCLALALCNAISLPQQLATPAHLSLINMLSPQTPTPFPWSEVNKPVAKYQYAALVGKWAKMTEDKTLCQHVFPSCSLSPAEVIKSLADRKISCREGLGAN